MPPPKPSALDLYKLESGAALDALRARLESELSSVAQEFDNLHAAVDVLAQKSDNLHAAVDVLTQKSDNLHTAVDVLDQSRLLHQEELGAFRAETGLSLGDAARDVRLLRSRVEEVRTALNVWGFIVSMVMLVFIVAFISQ